MPAGNSYKMETMIHGEYEKVKSMAALSRRNGDIVDYRGKDRTRSSLPACSFEAIQHVPKATEGDEFIHRVTNMSVPRTAGTFRDKTFGIPEYSTPVRDVFRPKVKHFTTGKENYKCFTDLHSKLYQTNPGPAHKSYEISWDWRKTSAWRSGAFDKHNGNFLKKPRQTFTEETMKI
jgi:hypothetical protein